MKEVLFMRHAKACQATFHQSDHERSLTNSGIKEVESMSKFIKSKKIIPDIMLVSDSKRTQETWKYLNKELNNTLSKFDKYLYLASPKTLINKIMNLDNLLDSVIILAHNPGITDVFNDYFNIKLDHMPTCGVGCIEFHTDKFENILDCTSKLKYLSYPSLINNG